MEGKEHNLACIDSTERVIEIAAGVSPKAQWDGFLHEYSHGLLSVSGFDQKMSEKMEEAFAQTLATALQELLGQLGVKLYEE